MWSGLAVGLLRFGAVAITTGGIVGGIWFVAQNDDSGPIESISAQVETFPTLSPLSPPLGSGPLSPPVNGDDPTATFPPAPLTPPLDDSEWRTYTSPLGFTIKYPPTWAVVDFDTPGLPEGHVRIMNGRTQVEHSRRIDAGILGGDVQSGEAWIEIVPNGFPYFDVEEIFKLCGPPGAEPSPSALAAKAVTIGGLPAVRCASKDPYATEAPFAGEAIWIGLPSGRVVQITTLAVEPDAATAGQFSAILSSVRRGQQ